MHALRFDDSLGTVLSADTASPAGAQSTWRQLVDLIGRGKVGASEEAIERLRQIRADVPPPVRAASARALVSATPPAALVALFAEDEIAVASPVLGAARLAADEWIALLAAMSPAARSILRHRRDLPPPVVRALESFGSVDFVLAAPEAQAAAPEPAVASEPVTPIAPASSFVSIAAVAAGLPVVAEALRRAERPAVPEAPVPTPIELDAIGPFPISELVARIDAYTRQRETTPGAAREEQP